MGLYVFDAYGTLFDVHAAAEREKDAIGPRWQQLSQTWRVKHIEYSWHARLHGQAGDLLAAGGAQSRLCHRSDGRRRERRMFAGACSRPTAPWPPTRKCARCWPR